MANTDSFIEEVSEEVRKDRMFALWKKYGPFIIAAVVLIVLAAFGKTYWDRQQAEKMQAKSGQYIAAIEADTPAETAAALEEFAAETDGAYGAIAKIRAAAAYIESGDTDKAVTLYEEVADNTKLDVAYRDLAKLKAVMAEIDTAESDNIKNRLNGLMGEDAPYASLAKELLAVTHIKAGENLEAREILTELAQDPNASQGIRSRAAGILGFIGGPIESESDSDS